MPSTSSTDPLLAEKPLTNGVHDSTRAAAPDGSATATVDSGDAAPGRVDPNVRPATELAADDVIMPTVRAFVPEIDLSTLSLDELCTADLVYNRELSWLDFNWRVMYQAKNEDHPLLEQLKFLAITSSNLDEFFRKRVGGLKRQKAAGIANLNLKGWSPNRQLALIAKAIRPMVEAQSDALLNDILPALAEHGLHILSYDQLGPVQEAFLEQYFRREVYPILTPLAVDAGHPFPFLSNMSLSVGVLLTDPVSDETRFARVKVPPSRPRWVQLDDPLHFVPLEEIIIHNLDLLFPGMKIVAAFPFRVTRNASVARNEDEADDLVEMIAEELREQKFAPVVRLEVAESMLPSMIKFLQRELELENDDVYPVRGPLRLGDLFALADLNLPHLKYQPWTPITPPRLSGLDIRERPGEFFSIMRQGDHMVHHPYVSFGASTQLFVEAASRDPQVLAIKQTLYRTSADSPIIEALIKAAERGKQVAVLVEVKARFDEAQNIEWVRKLEDAGCHVAYGLVGLKTHSKISLVIRDEEDGLNAYYHIGTGNYNPKTATLYTDLGIFGCRREIGADLMDLFNYLTGYSRKTTYRNLLVAPVNMRQRFLDLIDVEIENALNGRPARVIAKMNGLEDAKLVRKLYEASQAGVTIDLIVRGVCRLRPGIPGISDNIRVISVIGRFLEHSRIVYFENGGYPRYFIGSADWMTRNLIDRVEAMVPVEDPRLKEQIDLILHVCLDDYQQGWEMLPDGRYRLRAMTAEQAATEPADSPVRLGAHETLMRYTRTLTASLEDGGPLTLD